MKTLIMHGSFGSPNVNWFRWLESEIVHQGDEAILEQFPVDNWDIVDSLGEAKIHDYNPIQTLETWENFFVESIIPRFKGEEINLVCHSISPIFMLHMLEKYDVKIDKAVFVAPFFDLGQDEWHFYLVNKSFYQTEFDFIKIRSRIKQSYVVYGDNDPYVPATQSLAFAEKLGSTVKVVPNGEHCGSIFKEFPLILRLLQ